MNPYTYIYIYVFTVYRDILQQFISYYVTYVSSLSLEKHATSFLVKLDDGNTLNSSISQTIGALASTNDVTQQVELTTMT